MYLVHIILYSSFKFATVKIVAKYFILCYLLKLLCFPKYLLDN